MSTLPLFDRQALLDVKPTKMRPYQNLAIQTIRTRVREGKKRILVVGPTGMGKAVIMASIILTSSVPVMVVVHRLELVDQMVNQLARLGVTNVGVMRGDDERTNPNASVQVVSIQTLARRKKPPAGLILIDEAHRSCSDSMISHVFDASEYPRDTTIILGFTATPVRADGRPLGSLFDCLEVISTYAELIRGGFIVEPECYDAGPNQPNLSGVRTIGGDYDEGALGDVMRDTKLVGGLLDHWLALADKYPKKEGIGMVEGPRRRTFIFATGIQHSLDICERFSAAGVKIAHLDGETPEDLRRKTVKALGDGELEAISSVGVLLEGVDVPSAKCVVHARPTQSLVLYRQSVGRILRPWHPGCPDGCTAHPSVSPLVLDHASNISVHGFPHEDLHWSLTAKSTRVETKLKMKICKGCYAYVAASRGRCVHCGYEFKPEDAPKEKPIEETRDQLVRRSTTPVDMQRAFFDGLVQLARKRGAKPGFVGVKFKEHYGAWPPWAWSEEIKASFASDSEWQENFEAKLSRKAEKEKAETEAFEVPEDDAIEYQENGEPPARETAEETELEDDSFNAFLREQGIV